MTDQQQKALRLLGLARRARLLEIGEEPVGIVCRSGKAKLLLVARTPATIPSAGHAPLFRAANARISARRTPKTSWGTDWAAMPARCARLPIPRLQNRFLRHWAIRDMMRS